MVDQSLNVRASRSETLAGHTKKGIETELFCRGYLIDMGVQS